MSESKYPKGKFVELKSLRRFTAVEIYLPPQIESATIFATKIAVIFAITFFGLRQEIYLRQFLRPKFLVGDQKMCLRRFLRQFFFVCN